MEKRPLETIASEAGLNNVTETQGQDPIARNFLVKRGEKVFYHIKSPLIVILTFNSSEDDSYDYPSAKLYYLTEVDTRELLSKGIKIDISEHKEPFLTANKAIEHLDEYEY